MTDEKAKLQESIKKWRDDRSSAQKRWSCVHHLSLFGSILCSVGAGALIQVFNRADVASILTALAAALTGIAASGGFERKWRTNRLSRSKADCLLIDLDASNANETEIRKSYKLAIEQHDIEIVGERKPDAQSG